MNDVYTKFNRSVIYVTIIIFFLLFFLWYLSYEKQYYPQPNYHIYYNISQEKKQYINTGETKNINTDSITIGGHNSAHSSPIIASPYNSPKTIHFNDRFRHKLLI